MKIDIQGTGVCISYQYKGLPVVTGIQTWVSCWASTPLSVTSTIINVNKNRGELKNQGELSEVTIAYLEKMNRLVYEHSSHT